MDKRISQFNKFFSRWKITLPNDIESRMERGQIVQQGWTIKFLFGEDRNGKFLDYYAAHRMTNDRHVRIRSDGTQQLLPALDGMIARYEDPEKDARSKKEWIEKTKRVWKMLEEKGFTANGSEHGSFVVNTDLLQQAMEQDPENSPKTD